MLNLYWKIFLGFWLTTLIMLGGAFALSHYIPVNKNFEPGPPPRALAHKARSILRHGDLNEFSSWAAQVSHEHNVDLYLFGKNSEFLFKVDESPFDAEQWPAFIKELKAQRGRGINRGGRHYTLTAIKRSRFAMHDTEAEKLVISGPSARGEFARLFIRNAGIRFGIAVIISGFICFWLARYFTVPIGRLRKAMKTVADGDYSVRTMEQAKVGKDELSLLAQDFDRMTEKVQQTLDAQARLIKDVSHELRSPLARLQVALGLAQQKMTATQDNSGKINVDAELQKIDDEVHAIDDLVEQILSLPQRDLPLNDAIDLTGLLEHCVRDAVTGDCSVQVLLNSSVKEAVVATRGRLLNSVFENIISNAIRFSPPQSEVQISLEQSGQEYIIKIRDSGPGVEPVHLKHLFEPFYRTSEARERDTGGHGLGLAIAQRNVLVHQGQIEATNVEPTGLEIRISIPEKITSS